MKTMSKIIVSLAIALGSMAAHATDVAALRAKRISDLETKLAETKAEVAKLDAAMTSSVTFSLKEGKHLVVVAGSLAKGLQAMANSMKAGDSIQIVRLKAVGATLGTFAAGEAAVLGVDAGFLLYAIDTKKSEIARLSDQLEALQAQGN